MSKCKKCGAEIPDGSLFCSSCKKKFGNGINSFVQKTMTLFRKTDDFTAAYSYSDIENNKISAALCYVPFVCLYPVIAVCGRSKFVRFHANQGLLLFIAEILFFLILKLIMLIPFVSTVLYLPAVIVAAAARILFFGVIVYGAAMAFLGKAKELPLIGRLRILK